jgi:hypothetical protein
MGWVQMLRLPLEEGVLGMELLLGVAAVLAAATRRRPQHPPLGESALACSGVAKHLNTQIMH